MTVSASGKAAAEETLTACDTGRRPALGKPFMLSGWEVNPALNKVNHPLSGERHLEPRLMKLLCYLAANQGEVMSRDELVAELWPHVIVNENSLTRAVSELRKHLQTDGDTAGQAGTGKARELIQTVPKRGYLLSEAVEPVSSAPTHANPRLTSTTPDQHPVVGTGFGNAAWQFLQRPLASASTAAALSICLTMAAGFDFGSAEPLNSPVLASLRDEVVGLESPLYGAEVSLSAAWATAETTAGSIDKPAIAADGKRFAFIKHDISGSAIYLGDLDSAKDPVAVYMETCRISNLTWSPLGDALLFVREPGLTTAALFDTKGQDSKRELLSLDLKSLEISRLIEDDSAEDGKDEAPVSSLTYQSTPEKEVIVAAIPVVEPV